MSMVRDRSTSIEEFPEIRSGGRDVSTPLLRLHVVVSYVMALLRAVKKILFLIFFFHKFSRGLSVMKELTIQHQYNEEWNEPARKEGKL